MDLHQEVSIVGALIALGTACGGTETEAADRVAAAEAAPESLPESLPGPPPATVLDDLADLPWVEVPELLRATEPFTGDWPAIRERGVLRVLVTYSRTNFFLAEGRLRGFEYEMFRQLEDELAANRDPDHPPLQVAFLPVPFDDLLPALIEGRGDVAAASLSITPEREEFVSFSAPYLSDVDQVIVSHVGVEPLSSLADLSGREVHVVGGTAYVDSLERANDSLITEGLEPCTIVPAARGLTSEDLFELVHSGAYRHTVADLYVAELWTDVLDGLRIDSDVVVDAGGEIGWAVRKENAALRERLDECIRANRNGTLVGNVLFDRYYEGTRWISNPLLDVEHSKLGPILEPLQGHAEAFDFDWRLIAAQAYQESGLDAEAVSGSGAVGLMQLLPSTAKDMGVTDLRDPDRNLYAGIKYMAWLRKHFFDEPQLEEDVVLDFCLAAYNAGPGRVRRWREAAPDRGLDPDRWFGNVELLALEDVGMQPVQYVGNINKYFLLFTMSLASVERNARANEAVREESR